MRDQQVFADFPTRRLPMTGHSAREVWQELGRQGTLADLYSAPDQRGRIHPVRLSTLLTDLDARLPVGVTLSVCVQIAGVIPLLGALAPQNPLAQVALDQMLCGSAVGALAATEEDLSGSALLAATTEIRNDPDGLRLNGTKAWISNAGHCDYVLVLARLRQTHHFTDFGWALVHSGQPGASFQPAPSAAFREAAVGHLRFDGVLLAPDQVVGRPGRAMADFVRHMATERLASALWARALCRRILRDTHAFLVARATAQGTLWDNAAIRQRFALCVVEWSRLNALCTAYSAKTPTTGEAMVLKAASAASIDHIMAECIDLQGAEAFRDGGLASLREQVAAFGVAGGATGAMLAGLAEKSAELLGGPQ